LSGSTEKSGKAVKKALILAAAAVFMAGVYMAWLGRGQGPRIVLVGMDALTWDLMDPMLGQGRLPNFQALIDRGSHGELKTMRSTYISASIWTTILTGKHPKQHGIKGFFTTKGYAANSTHRRTKFLPQILGEQGIKTACVGFWATWPAEEINGYIVSDLASYGRFKDTSEAANKSVQDYSYLKKLPNVTWPEDLVDDILPVMLAPGRVPRETYEKVLPMSDPEWEEFSRIDRVSRDNDLSLLKFSVVTDLNFHRAGLEILRRHQPDAYMVYFQGPDIIEHFFWKYMEPGYFPEVSDKDARRFGEVIRAYYVFMDELLGEIVSAAADDAVVVVCSDHGMKRVRFRGQDGLHSGEHRLSKPAGIFIMAGPGVTVDPETKITGPEVYDIVPTILYLAGLAVGKDMHGKVAAMLVNREFSKKHPLIFIDTYDTDLPEKKEEFSPLDKEIKDRLRALGYID
jgi:predicted AlkP superfamily phosphohydrolase/phosphomutase